MYIQPAVPAGCNQGLHQGKGERWKHSEENGFSQVLYQKVLPSASWPWACSSPGYGRDSLYLSPVQEKFQYPGATYETAHWPLPGAYRAWRCFSWASRERHKPCVAFRGSCTPCHHRHVRTIPLNLRGLQPSTKTLSLINASATRGAWANSFKFKIPVLCLLQYATPFLKNIEYYNERTSRRQAASCPSISRFGAKGRKS